MHKFGWKNEQIEILEDKNYRNIEKAYQIIEAGEEEESDDDLFVIDVDHGMNSYDRAARVAAAYSRMTEPIMKMPEGLHAVLAAMPDNAGVKGDVRDIRITIYASESKKEVLRELGISLWEIIMKQLSILELQKYRILQKNGQKANSLAVKNFWIKWKRFKKVIEEYQEKYSTWSEVEEKKEKVYLPIVEAFVEEIRRLGMASKEAGDEQRKNASKFAKLFFQYMFGTRDFYKFIKKILQELSIADLQNFRFRKKKEFLFSKKR